MYYVNPVLPPEMLAKNKVSLRPRTKNRSIARRFSMNFTHEDLKKFADVEKFAQQAAGVSLTTVIRVAIDRYAAYITEMGETDEGTAEVIRELRRVTGDS